MTGVLFWATVSKCLCVAALLVMLAPGMSGMRLVGEVSESAAARTGFRKLID